MNIGVTHRQRPIKQPVPDQGLGSAGLVILLIGAILPAVDFYIVNIALPAIKTTLHANPATLELVVAAYGIPYALLVVLGGRLGDAFGRRKLFITGLTAFTATSLACGLAPSAGILVAARAAQGASAALMLPQVLSTIQASTSHERRSVALGIYGAAGGLSSVVGQLLGGILVAADIGGTSWRPIFLVNLPIGLVGLMLAKRTVPETRSVDPIGVDWLGTATLAAAMLAALVPMMEGRPFGWPVWIWALLGLFPIAGFGFVLVERRVERAGRVPLLPPAVLRLPSMRRGLLVSVPIFTGFGGFMFVLAITTQEGLRLGPMAAGTVFVPMAVGYCLTSLISSRVVTRFGARIIPIGIAIQAIGLAVMIATVLLCWPRLGPLELALGMLIAGLGQGFAITTLFRVILSRVPADRAGVGSGALETTRQTALALGVATLGTVFTAWSGPTGLGMRDAFVLVLVIQLAIAVMIVLVGRALPDPRDPA